MQVALNRLTKDRTIKHCSDFHKVGNNSGRHILTIALYRHGKLNNMHSKKYLKQKKSSRMNHQGVSVINSKKRPTVVSIHFHVTKISINGGMNVFIVRTYVK